jgi:hypothetical protein
MLVPTPSFTTLDYKLVNPKFTVHTTFQSLEVLPHISHRDCIPYTVVVKTTMITAEHLPHSEIVEGGH